MEVHVLDLPLGGNSVAAAGISEAAQTEQGVHGFDDQLRWDWKHKTVKVIALVSLRGCGS
jgi:hypothetical protein